MGFPLVIVQPELLMRDTTYAPLYTGLWKCKKPTVYPYETCCVHVINRPLRVMAEGHLRQDESGVATGGSYPCSISSRQVQHPLQRYRRRRSTGQDIQVSSTVSHKEMEGN